MIVSASGMHPPGHVGTRYWGPTRFTAHIPVHRRQGSRVTNDTSQDLPGVQEWLPAMREVLLSAPGVWTPPGPPGPRQGGCRCQNGGRPGPVGPGLLTFPCAPQGVTGSPLQRVSQPLQQSSCRQSRCCQPSTPKPGRRHAAGNRHHRSGRPAGTRCPGSTDESTGTGSSGTGSR